MLAERKPIVRIGKSMKPSRVLKATSSPMESLPPITCQPAEPDDRQRPQVGEQEHEGEVVREHPHGGEVLVQKLVVHRRVAGRLVVLAGEGPDHAHPREVLLQHRVQPPERLLDLPEERPDPADEPHEQQRDDGHYGQRDEGELPVEVEEQDRRADEHHDGVGELDDAGAREAADLLHVAGQAGDELARLDPVVVGEGEPLYPLEERVAQVVGYPLRGPLGQIPLQEREQAPRQREPDERPDHEEDDVHLPRSDAVVDGAPDQERRHQVRRGDQEQRDEGAPALPPVRAQVGQRPTQRPCPRGCLPVGQGPYPPILVVCSGLTKTTTRSSPGAVLVLSMPRYFLDIDWYMASRFQVSSGLPDPLEFGWRT